MICATTVDWLIIAHRQ